MNPGVPKIDRYLVALVILVVLSCVPIYYVSLKVESHVQKKLVSETVSLVGHNFENLLERINRKVGDRDMVIALFSDEDLRREVEEILSLMITPEVKYVYIVYRDEEGRFRFLADGSKGDRAFLGDRLEVLREDRWNEAMAKKKEVVIVQENLHTIGATYLKPIVRNGEVVALLAADFAVDKIEDLRITLGYIRNLAILTVASSVTFLYLAVLQYLKRRRLHRSLYVDDLTGAYSRRFLEDQNFRIDLSRYLIAIVDIDDFRKVNVTYGPEAGDRILRDLVDLIRKHVGEDSPIVRYAGESFLVLTNRKYVGEDPVEFFEDLRRKVKDHSFLDGRVKVSVSIGLDLSPEKARSLEEAIKRVDTALHSAKRKGKDRVEVYEDSLDLTGGVVSVSEIVKVIEEEKIACLLQPVVDLNTGKVSHHEVLARLMKGNGKILSPSQFLDELKGTYAYVKFTKRILKITVDILETREDLKLSVNLLPTDLLDRGILDFLKAIDPKVRSRMLIEITEVEDLPSFSKVKKVIERLRRLGYGICIDDFGSGYSNLHNLTQMNVDYLKIDGSIVRDIDGNYVSFMLTRMVTEFCKEIGVKVIAEYVETRSVLEKLKEIGVRYGQGYLLGKPFPVYC